MLYETKSYKLEELESLTPKTQTQLKAQLLENTKICQLCENEIQKPVLDHQHMTSKETIGQNGAGLVRGVLCNNCNQVLGKIETNAKRFCVSNLPKFLENVSRYLMQPNLPYIHSSETKRLKTLFKKSDYNKAIKELSLKSGKSREYLQKKYKYNKFLTKNLEELIEKSKKF